MEPLIVLLAAFAIAFGVLCWCGVSDAAPAAGRVALAAMFAFTGISHFVFTAPMVEMLPPSVPERTRVVQATGVLELLGAVGLLIPALRRTAAACLALFLVAVFPANVYAALHGVGMGGHAEGPGYLWFRAPLQLFFLAWTVWCGLWRTRPVPSRAPTENRHERGRFV